jgi:hypothetical protein
VDSGEAKKRGLDHPEKCLFCDQEKESIDRLLIFSVFAREFCFKLFGTLGWQHLAPQPGTESFMEWWRLIDNSAKGLIKKGLNSLVILGPWSLWKHRNSCVSWCFSYLGCCVGYGRRGALVMGGCWCKGASFSRARTSGTVTRL